MGFTSEEQDLIWRSLTAILWLGNVEFYQKDEQKGCKVTDHSLLKVVAEVWGFTAEGMVKRFILFSLL